MYHSSRLYARKQEGKETYRTHQTTPWRLITTPHSLILASSKKLGGSVGTILHKEAESYLINVRRKQLGTLLQTSAHLLVIWGQGTGLHKKTEMNPSYLRYVCREHLAPMQQLTIFFSLQITRLWACVNVRMCTHVVMWWGMCNSLWSWKTPDWACIHMQILRIAHKICPQFSLLMCITI